MLCCLQRNLYLHRLDWGTVVKMITDTARGMAFLHSAKPAILHRDLKSGNLLVDEGYNIKVLHGVGCQQRCLLVLFSTLLTHCPTPLLRPSQLTDFGLARVKSYTMTMTQQCGTFQWMAPEVLANAKYSESADGKPVAPT